MSAATSSTRARVAIFLVAPAILIVAATILIPILNGIYSSLQFDGAFSTRAYELFFSRGQYLFALRNSLTVGLASTVLCVVLVFPACAHFAAASERQRAAFLAGLGLCFVVSALIKTLAWNILLSRGGPLTYLLVSAGIIDRPIDVLYSVTAVVIGTTQIIAPMTAAIIFTGMRKVDADIVFATRSLGCGPVRTFFHAYLPQIRQSLVYASVLTFVLSAGIYVTPSLLGGPTDAMLGQVMNSDLVNDYENGIALASAAGSVLILVLIVVSVLGLMLAGKPYFVRRRS